MVEPYLKQLSSGYLSGKLTVETKYNAEATQKSTSMMSSPKDPRLRPSKWFQYITRLEQETVDEKQDRFIAKGI